MSKTFRQYDSRWGSKSYPPGSGCTMAGSGCGPTACADIIVNNPKHRTKTPANTRKYMCNQGYAVAGQGTAWNGIDACLKYYGFKVTRHNNMDSFFKEMAKPGRYAIILFAAGSRGGVTWTTGGHFVCATDYKVKNGKHYLYTRDPGARKNDGWHCYETTMRGLIPLIWTCYLPSSKKKPAKTTAKKKADTKKTTTVSYKVGKIYTLKDAMKVRAGSGTGYRWKKRTELTTDGKKHAQKGTYAVLEKGTEVTAITVKNIGNEIWLEIPSGWVCAKQGNTIFVK